jgi:hypothetical protein
MENGWTKRIKELEAEVAKLAAESAALDKIETWLLNHIEQMEEWK